MEINWVRVPWQPSCQNTYKILKYPFMNRSKLNFFTVHWVSKIRNFRYFLLSFYLKQVEYQNTLRNLVLKN